MGWLAESDGSKVYQEYPGLPDALLSSNTVMDQGDDAANVLRYLVATKTRKEASRTLNIQLPTSKGKEAEGGLSN